ncbi:glycoside hydrolase family 48 protein [Micromonospora sp. NPDC047753]
MQAYLDGGPEPTFNYHRFWAQADVAMVLASGCGHGLPCGGARPVRLAPS